MPPARTRRDRRRRWASASPSAARDRRPRCSGRCSPLDGPDQRGPVLGLIVINPNFESIGETKITSQNYDAEFGQATAGVVSVQTRSGTNTLHGSAFEFTQSDRTQARNPFSQAQADPLTGRFIP